MPSGGVVAFRQREKAWIWVCEFVYSIQIYSYCHLKFSTFHTRCTWSMRRVQRCCQPRVPPRYRIVALSFCALQTCIRISIWIVCPCVSWIWETSHVSSMMQGQNTNPLSFTAILGNTGRSFREDSPDPCLWSRSIYNVLLRTSTCVASGKASTTCFYSGLVRQQTIRRKMCGL